MATKDDENFILLLNKVHKKIFPYLSIEDLYNLKLTTKQLKNIVKSYISRNNKCVLKMPPNIKYTDGYTQNLDEIIKTRCENNFGKTASECEIHLQTKIFYKKEKASSTIPLKALKKIDSTGIKILLSITIDSNGLSRERLWETWSSYNILIEKILENLPNIKSLELAFLNQDIKEGGDTWFEDISTFLKKLEHLTSLSISGIINWNPVLECISSMPQITSLNVSSSTLPTNEFVTCIASMPQLISLNISEATLEVDPLFNCLAMIQPSSLGFLSVKILDMNVQDFALRLNTSIPGLVKLKLSNSYVESEEIYEALTWLDLPNLTSLDLSINDISITKFQFEIAPKLKKMTSLTSLNLSHNEIGVDSLLPLLVDLNKLVDLNLENNSIKSDDILRLIPILERMLFLSSLNLSSNPLDQDTINELKRKLWRVKNLEVDLNMEELD